MAQSAAKKREWHIANRERRLVAMKANTASRRQEIRCQVAAYLARHRCVDCGEGDPVVLDFDHLGEKRFNISDAVALLPTRETLDNEMRQCEIRCANCHRRRTHAALGFRDKLAKP